MANTSRREFVGGLAAAAVLPLGGLHAMLRRDLRAAASNPLRVRTITAGVTLERLDDLGRVETALGRLARARKALEAESYEIQTLRVATQPLVAGATAREREAMLPRLQALDALTVARDARVSIGPVLTTDRGDPELSGWIAELIRSTERLNCTVVVASPAGGVAPGAAAVAAETTAALARATPGGLGNFRFAAAANVPPGTPFFPVAWHRGPDSLAVGLESASLVEKALAEGGSAAAAGTRLRERLDAALAPVERVAAAVARRERCAYLGIDPSPAPGLDRSIGAAVEALARVPFGDAGTLDACAAITGALKSLRARTCGYAGLMLPVLEDPVLAKRASEGRYDLESLLLYSSVCGTGLDVVPIPGDTPVEAMTRIVLDVAALSARLRKPLSARLFPIPGKRAGETARFDDPYLTESIVMAVQ